MHIVGTAGHVDHGKSSLVLSLTGVNPDRWLEERTRGMTLDLGFARLRFVDGVEAGIVDVPGHERFLHNMLAGAAGMELLLLVVSATQGVMPQTLEHLQILSFLHIQHTIVVVTKSDLVEPHALAARVEDIRNDLTGTLAEHGPFVAVSNSSLAGIDALRERIHDELAKLPPRNPDAPAYLPVDRVFTLPGRGTIVTGTLMQGRIAVGDSLVLEPSHEPVRVRTLHVFGESRDIAFGGSRVALNIPGLDRASVARGDVVGDSQMTSRKAFRVCFTPLPHALPLLRKRTPVRAHIGSAEFMGTLRLAAIPQDCAPLDGELLLRTPVAAFPGVHFVLRQMSPKTTLGGGKIEAIASVHDGGEGISASHSAVMAVLREAEREPRELADIASKANLREDVTKGILDAMIASGDAVRVARPSAYLSGDAARELAQQVAGELQAIHDSEPWGIGATSIALSRLMGIPEALLVRLLAAFADDGSIVAHAGYYALPSHEPHLSSDQRSFFDELLVVDPAAPFVPVAFDGVVAQIKTCKIAGAQKAFDALLARGSLIKVGDALYRGTQIAAIHEKIEGFIDRNGRMTMAEFRDQLGTSRKYAVPLLEWFDSRGITVRSGDVRMLRTRRQHLS